MMFWFIVIRMLFPFVVKSGPTDPRLGPEVFVPFPAALLLELEELLVLPEEEVDEELLELPLLFDVPPELFPLFPALLEEGPP